MINKASHEATNNENYNTDRELVGGYDVIDGKLVINPAEAQVIRYYFSRTLELTNQYPSKPIDVVDKMDLDEVKDNTIKFVRTSDTPYEKVVEVPEITLNGENFYGTDTITINKYKNGTLIGQEMVKFRVKGIKQSGASVTDLISK